MSDTATAPVGFGFAFGRPPNAAQLPTAMIAFAPRATLAAPKLAELAMLDDAAFRLLFSGSPIKRIGRDRFVRNVLIAIGNSGDPALLPVAQGLCEDPDPVVADCARWALGRLAA
jgi:epoxyqueuosine reductase